MSHTHNHSPSNYNRAFALGVLLNIIFVIIEVAYGLLSGSMALLADAGHNLSDVLSLILAWGASWLAAKKPTGKRTYGFRKITILASLANAIILLFAIGGITWEAVGRIFNPHPVDAVIVIVVAAVGVVINSVTALFFISGRKEDLNIRGAYLHMAADAGVSLGVVLGGIAVMFTGWQIIDPLLSIAIAAVILVGTWSLLRHSLNLTLDAVPEEVDIAGVKEYLTTFENVCQVHDLHIWALSTTETALTVHVIIDNDVDVSRHFLSEIQQHLHDHFGIEHSTIQIEKRHDTPCLLNDEGCEDS